MQLSIQFIKKISIQNTNMLKFIISQEHLTNHKLRFTFQHIEHTYKHGHS